MNSLQLTNDEMHALNFYFWDSALPDFVKSNEDDLYYGYKIGDRMFDLNLYQVSPTEKITCRVNLCEEKNGEWHTTRVHCFLDV